MGYHCRCRVCQARQVKPRHPDEYLRGPRCRQCGRVNTLRVDKWANNRWRWEKTCTCGGYHFPHRMGSRWCHYRKDGTDRLPGDPDFKDRMVEFFETQRPEICNYDHV